MTPAEFRTVREGLGLTGPWLADRWDIAPRTIERWETGAASVAAFAQEDLALLEATAAEHVARHLKAMEGHPTPLLAIDSENLDLDVWPARWQRAIAFRVRQRLPALRIIDTAGEDQD